MKYKTKFVSVLTTLLCLLPLVLGLFGAGNEVEAADPGTVDVTLHKKRMDEFPSETITNTGKVQSDIESKYEGLSGVEFTVFDITTDFYTKLAATGSETAAEYKAKVEALMKTYKREDSSGNPTGTQVGAPGTTDQNGEVTFENLPAVETAGKYKDAYKVYLFEETTVSGRTAHANPLILVLPVTDEDSTATPKAHLTDIHLYPKNKIDDTTKELLDEDGDPIDPTKPGSSQVSYEVGKLIQYRATSRIPDHIGEILNDAGGDFTRYSQLDFHDAVTAKGVKFEGISKIVIGTSPTATTLEGAALTTWINQYFQLTEVNKVNPPTTPLPDFKNQYAGFTLSAKLNAAKSIGDPTNYAISKATAEGLAQYAGDLIEIYYGVSLTEHTAVDEKIGNDFYVDMDRDGGVEDKRENQDEVPEVWTGGRRFVKHESGNDNKVLKGAEFVVVRKTGPVGSQVETFLKQVKNDATSPTEWTTTWVSNVADATKITSDENGLFEVKGLEKGTYFLRETKAPEGFQLLTEDVEFEVDETSYTSTTSLRAGVANTSSGGFLPSTGGMGILAFLVVGLGLMSLAIFKYRRLQNQSI